MNESIFLKACHGEAAAVTPVWLMRQAGRYMKEYRAIRKKVSFLKLCKTPELAAEVTVTAVRKIRADAAIIFSDILLIPEAMGLDLQFTEGNGPVFHCPVRGSADVARLRDIEPQESLPFVYEAIRMAQRELSEKIPVIGFAGAPFTLASYMVEGKSSRHFMATKKLMYGKPGTWDALMQRLARVAAKHLNGQIEAGAQAVQLFDTWVGCLSPSDYREFVLPHVQKLIKDIKPKVPVLYFGLGTAALLDLVKETGAQVIGLDFHVDLGRAWAALGNVRVQGNLDPCVLLADKPFLKKETESILRQAGARPGHIFNLGHGVLPETPVDNVVALVDYVHEISSKMRA